MPKRERTCFTRFWRDNISPTPQKTSKRKHRKEIFFQKTSKRKEIHNSNQWLTSRLMYYLFVFTVCVHCLCSLFVFTVCVHYLCSLSVFTVCVHCFAFTVCALYLYSRFAFPLCVYCLCFLFVCSLLECSVPSLYVKGFFSRLPIAGCVFLK